MTAETLVEVKLLGLDLEDHRRSSEHHEELLREFMLIAQSGDDHAGVPARLMALIDELRERYSQYGRVNEEVEAARRRGEQSVDLVYALPASMAGDVRRFLQLLEEADEYCRRGDLLTLATPPAEAAFRRWYLEEVARQIEGEAPRPWPAVREAGG